MANPATTRKVPPAQLRWRLDPEQLPFTTTAELKTQEEIIGQKRGVEAFHFGIGMGQPGFNVFVTGAPGTGRLRLVKKLLADISRQEKAPDDLCYVNNFKKTEEPLLLRFKAGQGGGFRADVDKLLDTLKREVPQLFESQEYISRKKEIVESYQTRIRDFFKGLDKKVREKGFRLVTLQEGHEGRPELMPMVDGEPKPMLYLEDMVEKKRFPREEFEEIKAKYARLKDEIDAIFIEVRELQKELAEKGSQVDGTMFRGLAAKFIKPLKETYTGDKIGRFLDAMLEDMTDNLQLFMPQPQPEGLPPGLFAGQGGDRYLSYRVNLLVDNSEQKTPPVLVESFPNYRNLFGGIERVVDRSGVWRTDFSKIMCGSFVKANGGFLILNLLDLLVEPGVWPALKRALKTEKMEIQTYDPFSWLGSIGLKPEPIDIDIKVIVIADPYLYQLLRHFDEDVAKVFKVRVDLDSSMDNTEEAVRQLTSFIGSRNADGNILPFDREGAAAFIEQAVRLSGRSEKMSIRMSHLTDLIHEADYWARKDNSDTVTGRHLDQAVAARRFRSNMVEEKIQEMITRGSLLIDTEGEVVGQVNGLAVVNLGDYLFGFPSRITATTAMGREGVINIEREAEMSGSIHSKGVYILAGYLRRNYAQDKPLSMSASIAFEQSYAGVDGDSASSTELYALLSSLAELPVKQAIAVTGSVNQKGEVQAIGGVNEKIEGFYDVCRQKGELTGKQGVIIPASNVKDLMLRKDVVAAVEEGRFSVWSVRTIDEGLEILTGRKAGARNARGVFPKGSINALVDARLLELARGLQQFAESDGNRPKRSGAKRQSPKEKKARG
ncbi:MAG: ATP-binding protein [Thermodesulfobacteriota bacterium]